MKNFSTTFPLFIKEFSLNLNGRTMTFERPLVMGILNATPDSFYGGSRWTDPAGAVNAAREMLQEGATFLDLGAASSRPGAEDVPEEEELNRLLPVLEALRNELPDALISLDTWRSGIVKRCHERFRIDMVNDISAGRRDPGMMEAVAGLGLPYLIMHMQGHPSTMQETPVYRNVTDEVLRFFGEAVHQLRKMGISDILIDPGFGFGKTLEHNYQLLNELGSLQILELPLVAGISRKSMICKPLGCSPDEALNGTTAAHMAALMRGANMLRVHDVKPAVETVRIFLQIVNTPSTGV